MNRALATAAAAAAIVAVMLLAALLALTSRPGRPLTTVGDAAPENCWGATIRWDLYPNCSPFVRLKPSGWPE